MSPRPPLLLLTALIWLSTFALSACTDDSDAAPLVVTSEEDGETASQSLTLREAIELSSTSRRPITFDPDVDRIQLAKPIRLKSGVRIVGQDHDPLIVFEGRGSVFYIDGVEDVSVSGITITQNTGSSELPGDCITVRNGATRVSLHGLAVSACNDGLIDVTTTGLEPMQVSIYDTNFSNHDKAVLVSAPPSDPGECSEPIIELLITNSRFHRTGQRHPRASGRVRVETTGNVVRYEPFRKEEGLGAAYGVYADKGAEIILRDNDIRPSSATIPEKNHWQSEEPCTRVIVIDSVDEAQQHRQ